MKAKPKRILCYDGNDYMLEMDNHQYYLVQLDHRKIIIFRQPYSYVNHNAYVTVPKNASDIPLEIRKSIAKGLKTFPWKYAFEMDNFISPANGFPEDRKNFFWERHKKYLEKPQGAPFNLDEQPSFHKP